MDLAKIISLILGGAGWFAFTIQWNQHRKNRPILKIRDVRCIADLRREGLTICANIVNNGNVGAHDCVAYYLIINGYTMAIEDKGQGVWLDKLSKQESSYAEIPSFGQKSVAMDYTISTEPILTGEPLLFYFFPTETTTHRFFIVLILSYGDYRTVYNFLAVDLRNTIKEGMDIKTALGLMRFRRKRWWRFWGSRRALSKIVGKHDSYLETLLEGGTDDGTYEITIS